MKIRPENMPEIEAILGELHQQYPYAFPTAPYAIRPLKLNIHEDLFTVLADKYSKKAIRRTLRYYTYSPMYRNTLQEGAKRIDLEGQPCGAVTAEHIQIRQEAVEKIRKKAERRLHPVPGGEQLPYNPDAPPVEARIDFTLTIVRLPLDAKELRNSWQQFYVKVSDHRIQITLRPRVWKKLTDANKEFRAWKAIISGKFGELIKGGFVLADPGVRVVERDISDEALAKEEAIFKEEMKQWEAAHQAQLWKQELRETKQIEKAEQYDKQPHILNKSIANTRRMRSGAEHQDLDNGNHTPRSTIVARKKRIINVRKKD